jgi:adenosine deaminase
VYAEIRFCAALHTLEGLAEREAVAAVAAGIHSQQGVVAGLLLVALRSRGAEHGLATARLAVACRADGLPVVGMDVAGDEGGFPLAGEGDAMVAGVREAAAQGLPVTLHAGEWPEGRSSSMANLAWAVREPGVRRIGHAIAVRSGPELLVEMKKRNITVEVCPKLEQHCSTLYQRFDQVCLTSNVGNGFKVSSFAAHPVRLLQEAGVGPCPPPLARSGTASAATTCCYPATPCSSRGPPPSCSVS